MSVKTSKSTKCPSSVETPKPTKCCLPECSSLVVALNLNKCCSLVVNSKFVQVLSQCINFKLYSVLLNHFRSKICQKILARHYKWYEIQSETTVSGLEHTHFCYSPCNGGLYIAYNSHNEDYTLVIRLLCEPCKCSLTVYRGDLVNYWVKSLDEDINYVSVGDCKTSSHIDYM